MLNNIESNLNMAPSEWQNSKGPSMDSWWSVEGVMRFFKAVKKSASHYSINNK